MTALSYPQFLEAKAQLGTFDGFDPGEMPSFLFDFQAALVDWALRKGKCDPAAHKKAIAEADPRTKHRRNGTLSALGAKGYGGGSNVPGERRPVTYKPKPCDDCGEDFQPTGGRDATCPTCKAKR